MKPEAQRIAIAELDGWKWDDGSGAYVTGWMAPDHMPFDHRQLNESANGKAKKEDYAHLLPDYLSNRDAIIAVVLAQPPEVRIKHLQALVKPMPGYADQLYTLVAVYEAATATAEQHCHALLVATGRWEA